MRGRMSRKVVGRGDVHLDRPIIVQESETHWDAED